MKHLLQQPEDRGYPAEYLLSRIRGRRSRLITDWRQLAFDPSPEEYLSSSRYQGIVRERSPGRIWQSVMHEYRWVYRQMNESLRTVFRPFFLYTELRTLFICFRNLKEGNSALTGDLLDVSLLSNEVKSILATAQDTAGAVREIEKLFLPLSSAFSGLARSFESSGLRGVEQMFMNSYLAAVVAMRKPDPIMKTFFARLIDARNIMSIYKFIRYDQADLPPFIAGGRMPEQRLRGVTVKEDLFGICSLVREFFGVVIEAPDPTKVELSLYRGITGFLRKEGREPFGVGLILDYLWRCSLEATNVSILLSGKGFERDMVATELIK